jgi:hypothetical protein
LGYIKTMGGWWTLSIILIAYALTEGSRLMASLWISRWSENLDTHSTGYWLGIYSGISVFQTAVTLGNMIYIAIAGLAAAGILHDGMSACMMRAPSSVRRKVTGRVMLNKSLCSFILRPLLDSMLLLVFQCNSAGSDNQSLQQRHGRY